MAKKQARKKADIPKDESKADRFTRVVTPRINKAVKAIRVIGYCSGSTYEFTPEQVKQIVQVLFKSVDNLEANFSKKADKQDSFDFSSE